MLYMLMENWNGHSERKVTTSDIKTQVPNEEKQMISIPPFVCSEPQYKALELTGSSKFFLI